MIKQEMEYLQLSVGIEQPIMQRGVPDIWTRWVEATWITDIKRFLSTIDAGLDFTDIWHPQIQREGDVFIMDSIQDSMEDSHIQQVNRCRIFLEALTLADITTPDGTQLDSNIIIGRKNKSNYSNLDWPTQNSICAEGWKVWTTFLQQEYCNPNSNTLKRPLGDWIKGRGHKT